MVIVPPTWTPASFGAEKLTELGDIDFMSIVNPKEWDTRVLAYKPWQRHPFQFVNITSLLAIKRKPWSSRLRSEEKDSSTSVSKMPVDSTPTSVTS